MTSNTTMASEVHGRKKIHRRTREAFPTTGHYRISRVTHLLIPMTKTKWMENRCSSKRYAGWVAGCFLDGSRVASGWAGGVAGGGQKWVAQTGRVAAACGWWEWGEGTQYHPPRPFNPPVLEGAVEPVPTPHVPFSAHRTPNNPHHTLTASDGPAGECVRVDYLTRIRPHTNAHAHIYTHPESARLSLYTCSRRSQALQGHFR